METNTEQLEIALEAAKQSFRNTLLHDSDFDLVIRELFGDDVYDKRFLPEFQCEPFIITYSDDSQERGVKLCFPSDNRDAPSETLITIGYLAEPEGSIKYDPGLIELLDRVSEKIKTDETDKKHPESMAKEINKHWKEGVELITNLFGNDMVTDEVTGTYEISLDINSGFITITSSRLN